LAIPNFSTYKAKLANPWHRNRNGRGTSGTQLAKSYQNSYWLLSPFAGATPAAAAVPTNATTGALGQPNSAGTLRLLKATLMLGVNNFTFNPGYASSIILADRLSHQGGLSGTVTTAQTTNLPTAALTRYTTGAGVMAMAEIYTGVGSGLTTFTVSYTNQAGTAGQTSIATAFGAGALSTECFPVPLASGDSGVRAVASLTLAASTGTAGNFGVTLFKPIYAVPCTIARSFVSTMKPVNVDALLDAGANLPQIQTNACLWHLGLLTFRPEPTTGFGDGVVDGYQAEHLFAED
jgi:hypothetical protein